MTAPSVELLTTYTGGAVIVVAVLGALLVIIQTGLREQPEDDQQHPPDC